MCVCVCVCVTCLAYMLLNKLLTSNLHLSTKVYCAIIFLTTCHIIRLLYYHKTLLYNCYSLFIINILYVLTTLLLI